MSIFSFLQRLVGADPEPKPRPAGWNKTLNDLSAENRSLTGQEIEWAREYDREQLRSWARFPRNDEVFEATHDVEVTYLVDSRGPYTEGGKGVLPKGARIRVSVHMGDLEPVGVYAMPLDEKDIAEKLIPSDDRNSTRYAGYSLFLNVAQLNKDFSLVSCAPGAPPA
jgi:hypothetical protein